MPDLSQTSRAQRTSQPMLKPAIWLCTDGAAGNLKQAHALAEGLNQAASGSTKIALQEIALPTRALPWRVRLLAPRYSRLSISELDAIKRLDGVQPQQIAIGCGRVGAIILDALKRRHPSLRTVQILHPRCALERFDWVVCPEHDQARGANVLSLPGALTAIDDSWLRQGRSLPAAEGVRRLVLIGAPTRNAPFQLQKVLNAIAGLPREGLCISVSRRTPAAITDALHALGVRLWRGEIDGANPYQAWLSAAEEIWVTPDSVNMLSEASATSATLRVFNPECVRGKIAAFLASLQPRLMQNTPFRPSQAIFARLRQLLSAELDGTGANND